MPLETAKLCLSHFKHLPIEIYGSTETGGIAWREQSTSEEPWQVFPTLKIRCSKDELLEIKSPLITQKNWFQTNDFI